MKKLFITLSCILSLAIFAACEKEKSVNAPDTLVGTAWLYEETDEDGVDFGMELDFISASKVDLNFLGATDEVMFGFEAGSYSYTYKKPNVTIDFDGEKISGSISGKKLTLDGEVFVLEEE